MSAAGPSQGANSVPAGGRDAAKPQAWGGHERVSAVYDFWLGLLPQFFAQWGAPYAGVAAAATSATSPTSLPFPADQVAKAAAMTQQALQALAQAYVPMLQAAGTPGLLGHWTSAMPSAASLQDALGRVTDSAAATARMATATLSAPGAAVAYERTFGAVSDALGLGPLRKLQSAAQELIAAGIEQNDARVRYALLVQGAFSGGFDALLARLAAMAKAGERVDSVLALLRLWAVATEQAVHEVLQSEQGLAATAAIARASLAYRRKLQHVASLVADTLDMATRRDLDEAFREIQALKRELRALRAAAPPATGPAPARKRARKGKATP